MRRPHLLEPPPQWHAARLAEELEAEGRDRCVLVADRLVRADDGGVVGELLAQLAQLGVDAVTDEDVDDAERLEHVADRPEQRLVLREQRERECLSVSDVIIRA